MPDSVKALIPLLLVAAVAFAQEPAPPVSQPTEQAVIRAWELHLKESTTVAAVSGTVHITRAGRIVDPVVGSSIEAGDLVQITPNSSLTLNSAPGVVTLTSAESEWFKFVQ